MLHALLALISPLWDRKAAQGETPATVSRFLVVVAVTLFAVLAIILVDMEQDELRALGLQLRLAGGAQPINAVFLSP